MGSRPLNSRGPREQQRRQVDVPVVDPAQDVDPTGKRRALGVPADREVRVEVGAKALGIGHAEVDDLDLPLECRHVLAGERGAPRGADLAVAGTGGELLERQLRAGQSDAEADLVQALVQIEQAGLAVLGFEPPRDARGFQRSFHVEP